MLPQKLLEKISKIADEFRGKIIFVLDATGTATQQNFSDTVAQAERAISVAALENISPEKSIFENLAAPLIATGTPWEIAHAKISAEMQFWFGQNSPEIAHTPASAAPKTIALARALLARKNEKSLLAPAFLLDAGTLNRLRERAAAENFSIFVFCENFAQTKGFGAAQLCVFYKKSNGRTATEDKENFDTQIGSPDEIFANPATLSVAQKLHASSKNVFAGTLLGTGAGEFFAGTSAGQIHGRICGNFSENADEISSERGNEKIEIFLPPEIFHIDAFPPEENFFAIENGGEIFFDGKFFLREFFIKSGSEPTVDGNAQKIVIASQFRQTLEISTSDDGAFAWFFPEDALGFLS